MRQILPRDKLMAFLHYEAGTGIFTWAVSPSQRAKVGAVAGHRNGQGYWEIELRGTIYQAHRLAWLFVHGDWPKDEIDHVNGVKDDNRLSNLREATKSQNQHNRRRWTKYKASIFKGVYWHKASGKWTSYIQTNNERTHLGLFHTELAAYEAYKSAAIKLHKEFARS